jgi:transposase
MPRSKRKSKTLEQLNLDAAGLDIGATEIWVCVPDDRDAQSVRCFATFTPDLHALADWLCTCGITSVAMESTGVYWIPIYEILEERGMRVCLVNAQATKNVSGRKTDVLDCQWIQQLHTYGLLAPSFRPPADICVLRSYVRQRESLLQDRARQIQHMQKALNLMNLKLTSVLTDLTGLTGMQIIRTILAGERDPVVLARFRDPRCKASEADIVKALTGNYQPEHLFALRQALEGFDFYTQQLLVCDAEIEAQYAVFQPQVDLVEQPLPEEKRRHRPHHPHFDLRTLLYQTIGIDLTAVPGIDVVVAQDLLAEIGTDMTKWKTVKHFAAWLGLAPNNKSSAGKIKSRRTQKNSNRASTAFRLAAQAVGRTQTSLGAFYRRIKAKHGAPVAITATAHKIARIVYHMVKNRMPYVDTDIDVYLEHQRKRSLRSLQRLAKKLNVQLVSDPEPAVSEEQPQGVVRPSNRKKQASDGWCMLDVFRQLRPA